MNFTFNLKKVLIGGGLFVALIILILTYMLAGLRSDPVEFGEPPAFVDQFVMQKHGKTPTGLLAELSKVKLTKDYFHDTALVRDVIVNGEPVDELIKRFTHPDKAKRVSIAFAFGEVNFKLSHNEETNFDKRRDEFWLKVANHKGDIQNALFEALIASAQERSWNYIPYTLAWWMQEQKEKSIEVLTWAAKHHPDTWIRNFCVYYIVQYSESEKHAKILIKDRIHDPVFRVRKQVFDQRIRRIKEAIFGKSEA